MKIAKVSQAGGFMHYIGVLVRVMIVPEIFTTLITVALINHFHNWLKLNCISNNWRAIGRYELSLLPVFLVSFLAFNPVTQTIRYVLERYSHKSFSFTNYLNDYILNTYSWGTYFKYLFPLILIGYIAVNISLLSDYLKQRREAQEAAEAQAAEASQKALALSTVFTAPKPAPSSTYLNYLKGKNTFGELDFPVTDVYFFTIEDRYYYAELAKGRYLVGKTLNELDAELDPSLFFRIKRDYIVNRHAVLNYAYWENGKYIVRLNTPERHEIVVPRARMQEFREWLQGNQRPYADSDSDIILSSQS
ncbi:LytTR family DNA-binding domain-containing protein [Spirosoma soli]